MHKQSQNRLPGPCPVKFWISPQTEIVQPISLFQCLIIFSFLVFLFNLTGFRLYQLFLVISLGTTESGSFFFIHSHQIFIHTDNNSSLLQAIQSQLSVSLHINDTPVPWSYFWPCAGPTPLDLYLSCTREPRPRHNSSDLSQLCWAERKDHIPWPAGKTLSNLAQDTISFQGHNVHCSCSTCCPSQPVLAVYSCLALFTPGCKALFAFPVVELNRFLST